MENQIWVEYLCKAQKWWLKVCFISNLVKGVRAIRGFEKINLVKLLWWGQDHVRVTCDSIPSILTGF